MRRVVLALACAAIAVLPTSARQTAPVPELPFVSVPNPLTMPNDVHFGEIAGVAVNSKKHVFVFSRGNVTGPAYMDQAAQLLEFDPAGKFVREIGKNNFAHVVRARRAHRQAGQHLDRRQRVEHDRQVQPAGPRRMGVRPQGRVVAPRRAARLRLADRRAAEARRAAGDAAREQQPAQPGAGASRQRLQPAHRRGVGFEGQLLLQRRLRQLARRARSTPRASGWPAGARSARAPASSTRRTASRCRRPTRSTSPTAATAASRCSTPKASTSASSPSTCRSIRSAARSPTARATRS